MVASTSIHLEPLVQIRVTAQIPDRILIDGVEHDVLATPLDAFFDHVRSSGVQPAGPELVAVLSSD